MRRKDENRRVSRLAAVAGRTILGLFYLWVHGVLASFIMNLIYRSVGRTAPGVLDFTFVLLLSALIIIIEGKILMQFRPRHDDPFSLLAEAYGKIARGDYDIDLDLRDGHGHFDRLMGGLNEMTDSLRQAEEMRQRFISDMSHEIQSPLTSIRGFARILKEEELDREKRKGYLEIIEEESLRLSRLTEDLLSMTKLESTDLLLKMSEFRLDRQIRDVILNYEPLWREKNLEIIVDLAEETIRADRDLMRRLWNNLFHNAVKFSPSGGKIELSLRREEDGLALSVKDGGMGIAGEDLPRIFDRFHKGDKSRRRTDRESGTGLGLSIARRIVSLHGGEIKAESEGPGKGAVFTVKLPLPAAK